MPIRPENRDRYPVDWPEISERIRHDRASNRCECRGECGRPDRDHHAETRSRVLHEQRLAAGQGVLNLEEAGA